MSKHFIYLFFKALIAAKQVHIYGRDADDTLEWIQEKEGVVSREDYGHDLESAQGLVIKHDALEVKKYACKVVKKLGYFFQWPLTPDKKVFSDQF